MADIKEVNGVFGGVELGTIGGENVQASSNLPAKTGFWNRFMDALFTDYPWNHEIKVVLTPYQQKVEDEINEFLHQEITWEKVHDFLFQEVSKISLIKSVICETLKTIFCGKSAAFIFPS